MSHNTPIYKLEAALAMLILELGNHEDTLLDLLLDDATNIVDKLTARINFLTEKEQLDSDD